MMEKVKESIIKGTLTGRPINSIKLFQVNDNYLIFGEQPVAIIDGGIEFFFIEGIEKSYFTIGFHEETESLGFSFLPFHLLYQHENKREIELDFLKHLVGLKISAIAYKEIEGSYYDPEIDSIIQEDVMVEVLLTFENGDKLQVAIVDYSFEQGKVSDFYYSSVGEILLSLNNYTEISS